MSSLLKQRQQALVPTIEQKLAETLAALEGRAPERLLAAMRHSLLAGGKRLRPWMVIEVARAAAPDGQADVAAARGWPGAIALEMIHTYSLIHDDLPALDDDDVRRGRPTVHKAFDEATAILAGDALLTDAFGVLARAEVRAGPMCGVLAEAAGSVGMVAGQQIDIESEGQERTLEQLQGIHARKTGCLFEAACLLGGHAAEADDETLAALKTYGARLGLAFQIADDVLDVVGDAAARGKRSGGDLERDKATYVRLLGLDEAKARAVAIADEAAALAGRFGERGEVLVELARFAAARET
jgi:geranylgeranyl diphosphate synthase type II